MGITRDSSSSIYIELLSTLVIHEISGMVCYCELSAFVVHECESLPNHQKNSLRSMLMIHTTRKSSMFAILD